ncbi:MAG: thioredoxin domain-containing protein, partial [Planctomycetota bacterium]
MPRLLRILLPPLLAAGMACGGEEDDKKKSAQGSAETVPGKQAMRHADSERKPNRLAKEKSPYLLQHAYNPVDWYPWGEEAFARAKKEQKPIFLSIGYSTCHWCHVMEHESFENDVVAAYLNAHFISIKVDREERPDVDEVYMTAVQVGMRIQGGWPLSVWLTPDRKPFLGGTYFPPEDKFGRKGFLSILKEVNSWWEDPKRRTELERRGGQISELVKMVGEHSDPSDTGPATLEEGVKMIEVAFDEKFGGFGNEPKFPSPSTLDFLMRRAVRKGNERALHQVRKTLDAMQNGGIHDHVGGGFHRYSVTRNWLVPHFEKMLYDNAQLLGLYAWAHLVTGDASYAATARDIATWVRREMTHPDGGFYSAQDADDPGGPEGEGGFYIWDPPEIRGLFDGKQAEVVLAWFGISDTGNWFVQGHQENPGKTLLEIKKTPEQVGKLLELPAAQVESMVQSAIARMYEVREKRPKPITDTKVLAAWNALMISGYCRAYQALGDAEFLAAAEKAGGFLRTHLTREDGHLYRRWREGEAAHDGVLPDYAYTIAAYLDLYETTFDQAWLQEALRLNAVVLDSFHDKE